MKKEIEKNGFFQINIRIGPSKEKGAKPDYGNFAGAAYESLDNIDDIMKSLEEEMAQAAKELEFERAGELRDQIKELKRIALY